MRMSQAVFAKTLNVSGSTVRAWEQSKRSPEGPSLRLLELAEREPALFLRTLSFSEGNRSAPRNSEISRPESAGTTGDRRSRRTGKENARTAVRRRKTGR